MKFWGKNENAIRFELYQIEKIIFFFQYDDVWMQKNCTMQRMCTERQKCAEPGSWVYCRIMTT